MNFRRAVGSATALAAAAAAGGFLLMPVADAASTVDSSLTLAGPVTNPCLTPASVVNAPAGSTVHFTTSLLGSSTAGATNPLVAPAVEILVSPPGAPVVKKVIAPAYGVTSADFTVPASGKEAFTYSLGSASGGVLGSVVPVLANLVNSFQATGVGASVTAKWQGQIVVGGASNACSVQPQVPSVGITPTVPGVNLPPVNVPGLTPPGLSVPNVPIPGLPGGSTGSGSSPKSPTSGMVLNYKPYGQSLADKVMPKGYGSGSGASSQYVAPGLDGSSLNAASMPFKGGTGSNAASKSNAGPAKAAPSSVDVAANSTRSAIAGLPALMVVGAVVALSAATAFYARTFLMHRPLLAKAAARR